jgi:poly(A) polymerase
MKGKTMTPEKSVELFINQIIQHSEFQNTVYSVGGYVRDEILGLNPKDLDIVVEMDGGAERLTHYIYLTFPNLTTQPVQMGANYPIWQITFKSDIRIHDQEFKTTGAVVEFADSMREIFPDSESRQRVVEFASLKEDIARRDFSCNMLVKNLSNMSVADVAGTSVSDISNGIIKGHPEVCIGQAFNSDPLRLLRCARFYCKYSWKIPLSVVRHMKKQASRINIVSKERISAELIKMARTGNFHKGMKLLKVTGILKEILPEIDNLSNVQQGIKYHFEGNVWKHTFLVMKNAQPNEIDQLAALFHDIGKQYTYDRQENGKVTFYGHDIKGGKVAERILKELKFDNKTSEKIAKIVSLHMRPHFLCSQNFRKKPIFKFIRDCGEELENVIDLADADCLGMIPTKSYVKELKEKIELVSLKDLPNKPILNGNEIIEILGIEPGPIIREVVVFLMDLADDYYERSEKLTKEIAIEKVKERFGNEQS